jgi:5-(carboxyamino)imidazole ribonucleotide synthase
MKVLEPGSTIGVLGSGQLGRMFAIAARRLGYRVHTFSPDDDTPTGQVADLEIAASWDDLDAVRKFARAVDVVTFEFENVPAETAAAAAEVVPIHPSPEVLQTSQHRLREKTFLERNGFPVARYVPVATRAELPGALSTIGAPAVLKAASAGYDGKGQAKISQARDADEAWTAAGAGEAILEEFVRFEKEVSVIAARSASGEIVDYGVIENEHRRHILDISAAPASIAPATAGRAREIARGVLEALHVIGVLCVEFFVTEGGHLLVNELAPRPHNSGHLTIDACETSQFEQQLRAVCGLPLGSTELIRPAAMANLLGDLWEGAPPDFAAALSDSGIRLHLYGKTRARPGRKMGHLTAVDQSPFRARERVLAARARLAPKLAEIQVS